MSQTSKAITFFSTTNCLGIYIDIDMNDKHSMVSCIDLPQEVVNINFVIEGGGGLMDNMKCAK